MDRTKIKSFGQRFSMKKDLTVQQNSKGFTLLELVLVFAILTIMAAIAAPPFQRLIQRNEVQRIASDFQATLEDAKRKAYVAGRSIGVCPVNDITAKKPTCGSDWSMGWIAFADLNNDRKFDDNEPVVSKNIPNSEFVATQWDGESVIRLTPRNTIGDEGTMRFYYGKDTNKRLHEMRVELSALGSVKFYN